MKYYLFRTNKGHHVLPLILGAKSPSVQLLRSIRILCARKQASEREVGKKDHKNGNQSTSMNSPSMSDNSAGQQFPGWYFHPTVYFKDCEQYFFKGSKALIYSKKLFLYKSWIIQLVPDGNFRLLFFAFHFCRIISLTVTLPASGRSYVLLYSILVCIIFKETGPQDILSTAEQGKSHSLSLIMQSLCLSSLEGA